MKKTILNLKGICSVGIPAHEQLFTIDISLRSSWAGMPTLQNGYAIC